MQEKLIKTPSIDEALAFTEAFLFGSKPLKLWITGQQGTGKTFLANWARNQTKNGKRGAIFDGTLPDFNLPFWISFQREVPDNVEAGEMIEIIPPEYERKMGVLREWATVRNLRWEGAALNILLQIDTNNLQRLRSIAERSILESATTSNMITEVDMLRTLARIGLLDKENTIPRQQTTTQMPENTTIH